MPFSTKTENQEPALKQAYSDLLELQEQQVYSISKRFIEKDIPKEVLFVCDYEGIIQYQSSDFSLLEPFRDSGKESINSILDFIHPEDVLLTIENLVVLLQESVESVVFEARFLCDEEQYYYTKWHVGYLRGMFYFYPLDVPVSRKPGQTAVSKSANKHELFWKMELAKTLASWDRNILHQIKSCTNI
tara:strand:- start:20753 stop:21316 length:564 start_codon:yes stop_codon:yes gene_type:complete